MLLRIDVYSSFYSMRHLIYSFLTNITYSICAAIYLSAMLLISIDENLHNTVNNILYNSFNAHVKQ